MSKRFGGKTGRRRGSFVCPRGSFSSRVSVASFPPNFFFVFVCVLRDTVCREAHGTKLYSRHQDATHRNILFLFCTYTRFTFFCISTSC